MISPSPHIILNLATGHILKLANNTSNGQLNLFISVMHIVDQEGHQVIDEQQIPILDLVNQFVHELEDGLLLSDHLMSQQ